MAKKLNKNLVIGLAALGFAVTTAAGILMVFQLKQTDPKEFVTRAEALAQQKNWKEASAYYQQAYNASKDPQYLVLAGDMQTEAGKEREAMGLYNQAVLINPALLSAQEKLLKIRLQYSELTPNLTDAWREVQKSSDAILELQKDHPRATYARGAALLGLKEISPGNEDEGIKTLEHAIELAPTDADATTALAAHFRRKQDPDSNARCEKLLRDLVKATTTPGRDAALARCGLVAFLSDPQRGESSQEARLANRQQRFEEAGSLLAGALELAGSDPEIQSTVHNRTADYWIRRWNLATFDSRSEAGEGTKSGSADPQAEEFFGNAVASLKKSIEVAPNEFEAYLQLSQLYRLHGDMSLAQEALEKRIAGKIVREGMKAPLNRYRRYQMLVELASVYIQQAAEQAGTPEQKHELLTKADMNIEHALSENPNGAEALDVRGRVRFTQGKFHEAVLDFKNSLVQAGRPNWMTSYYLASALVQLSQYGEANDALVKGLADRNAANSPGYWLLLARVKLSLKEPQEALQATMQVLNAYPKHTEALLLKAAAQEALNNSDQANKTLADAGIDRPDVIGARAQLLANEGRYDDALELLRPHLEKDPAQVDLVRGAVAVYLGRKDNAAARQVVATALAKNPDDFDLKLLTLQTSDKPDEEKAKEFIALLQTLPDEFVRVMQLGRYYDGEKKFDEARTQYYKAIDLIVNEGTDAARKAGETVLRNIVDRLFQIGISTNNLAELDKLVELGTKHNLDAAEGMSFKGRRLLVDGMLAQQRAQELAASNPEEAAKQSKAARAAYDKAITALKQSIEKFPSSAQTHAQLGEAYVQVGRSDEARLAFEQANEKQPLNLSILRRLAELAESSGDDAAFRKWLEQCKRAMGDRIDPWVIERSLVVQEDSDPRAVIAERERKREEKPDDAANLYRLASLYQKVGDPVKSEERVDELTKLVNDDARANAVAELLRQLNKNDKALNVLQQHLRDAPADQKANAQLLIAEHYAKLDDRDRADGAYLAAADSDQGPRVCTTIARHFMATGRPTEAMVWFDKALADTAAGVGQIDRTTVRVLRVDALVQLDRLTEAVKDTEDLIKDDPTNRWAMLLDAQVAQTTGRTEESLKKLDVMLERYPNEARAILRRAEILGSLGRWEQAISGLEKLRASDPDVMGYAPRILLARAYQQVKRDDVAKQDLEEIVKKDPSAENVVTELVNMYNRVDDQVNANRLITTMLNKNPNAIVWLVRSAQLAAKQKPTPDRVKALANFKEASRLSGYHPIVSTEFLKACTKDNLGTIQEGIDHYQDNIPPGQRVPQVTIVYAQLLAERGNVAEAVDAFRTAAKADNFRNLDFLDAVAAQAMLAFGKDKAKGLLADTPVDPAFERINKHILCVVLRATGEIDEAEKLLQELQAGAQGDAEKVAVAMHAAHIHESRSRWEDAKAAYLEVLKAEESNLIALNNIAYLLTDKLNQPEDAVSYARRAVQLSPRPEVLDTLGWAYVKAKQPQEAVAQFMRARTINPDFTPSTYHLAEVFRQGGKFKEAIDLYNLVIAAPTTGPYSEFHNMSQEGLQKANGQIKD
jgi:tetratricopeptide (TPR) repeat protein